MKKRILSILLVCCMVLTMPPTAAFAAVSDSLGNTPEENQAILEQVSALEADTRPVFFCARLVIANHASMLALLRSLYREHSSLNAFRKITLASK